MARGIKRVELTEEQIAEIIRLHELGIPRKYIAILVGVSTHYVKRTLEENNLL